MQEEQAIGLGYLFLCALQKGPLTAVGIRSLLESNSPGNRVIKSTALTHVAQKLMKRNLIEKNEIQYKLTDAGRIEIFQIATLSNMIITPVNPN